MSKHRQQDGNSSRLGNPQQRQAQQNPARSGTDGNDTPSRKSGQGKDPINSGRGPNDEQKRTPGRDTEDTNPRKGATGELADDRDYGHGDRQTKRNDDLSSG